MADLDKWYDRALLPNRAGLSVSVLTVDGRTVADRVLFDSQTQTHRLATTPWAQVRAVRWFE